MPTDLTDIGTITFADNTYGSGVLTGGTLLNAAGLWVAKAYTAEQKIANTSSDPTMGDWPVFTDLLLRQNVLIDFMADALFTSPLSQLMTLSTPFVGVRGRVQVEGNYTFNFGPIGTPIGFQNMQSMTNAPGVSMNLQGAHSIINQAWYIADGGPGPTFATVTGFPPIDGSSQGPTAFYDNSVLAAVNSGHLDLETNSIALASFHSGVLLAGNVDLFEQRQFEVAAPSLSGGASISTVVGLHVPFLSAGTNNIGIRNGSVYVASRPLVGQSITAATAQINPASETIVIVPNAAYTLTSNPSILNGAEFGQRLRILNSGTAGRAVTLQHGLGVDTGTGLPFTLRPGECVDLEYVASTGSSRWVIVGASQPNGFITGNVAGGGSAKVVDPGSGSLNLSFSSNESDANPRSSFGLLLGQGAWTFGPGGGTAPDIFCLRTGPGIATYTGSLDINAGRLREIRSAFVWSDDLTRFLTAVTTDSTLIGATDFQTKLSGTGTQVSQAAVSSLTAGSALMTTGSTGTGRCVIQLAAESLLFLTADTWLFFARFRIATLSSAADLFEVRLGFASSFSGAPSKGLYLRLAESTANFEAVATQASGTTATDTGVTAAAGQWYNLAVENGPTNTKFTLDDGTSLHTVTISTNRPPDVSALAAGAGIFKDNGTTGTTPRTLEVDFCSGEIAGNRGSLPARIGA